MVKRMWHTFREVDIQNIIGLRIIETERLILRELVNSDKEELAKILTDPDTMKFYPAPFSDVKVVD